MIKAFTLIELIVVISIISIFSIFPISNYFNNLDKNKLEEKLLYLKDFVLNLDKKVKDKEIFDYKIDLNGPKYWLIYKNLKNKNKNIFLSGSRILISSGTGEYQIFKEEKFVKKQNIDASGVDIGNEIFEDRKNYFIYGNSSGENINSIVIFKLDSIDNTLKQINPISQNLKIQNIFGIKEFYSSGVLVNDIEISFEDENGNQSKLLFQ